MNKETKRKILNKLSYYEREEERGRLVIFPCKVGDILYELDENTVSEYEVTGFFVDAFSIVIEQRKLVDGFVKGRVSHIESFEICRTAFLNRGEAEAALRKMNKRTEKVG